MPHTTLPPPVQDALATLIEALSKIGFSPQTCKYSSADFGNFEVVFARNNHRFSLARDRGQFIVGAERNVLESAGLYRAFDSVASLRQPLLAWLNSQHAA